MAKWNRRQIGTVMKKSPEKQKFPEVPEFSIKITEDCSFKAGEYINLENKAIKLASLNAARDKMSDETYQKALDRIEKTPSWVFFEMVKLTKEG